MDVLDLVDLVAVDQVDAEVAVGLAKVALVDVEVIVQDVVFRALATVEVAEDATGVVLNVLDVVGHVKDARDALDVEDLVLVHVHQKERARHVQHAIAVLVAQVHVHLVRLVAGAVAVTGAEVRV